jgi:hypothetical protein
MDIIFTGRTQAVTHWLFSAKTGVQSRVTSIEIRGGRSGNGDHFFLRVLPLLTTILQLLHAYPSTDSREVR